MARVSGDVDDTAGAAGSAREPFDARYFEQRLGTPYTWENPHWQEFFGRVADFLVDSFEPKTALDVGCGFGFLVDALRARGVDASGIDASPYAVSQVPERLEPHCRLGSITDPIEGRYDLITCIEVVEHIAPEDTDAALDNLTAHTDRILFSSTPDDEEEPTHVDLDAWVRALAERGFSPVPDSGAEVVAPQAIVFARDSGGPEEPAAEYETARVRLAVAAAEEAAAAAPAELYSRPAAPTELYSSSPWRRRWAARAGHLNHGRILVRRSREVLREHGPVEVIRRARSWTNERVEEAAINYAIQGAGTEAIEARYVRWRARHEPDKAGLERQRAAAATLAYRPLVSVVVPVFDPPVDVLREAVESALEQTYDRLELCLANAGKDPLCRDYLDQLARTDERVRLVQLPENLGISGNSNEALALATGDYVALLDHDDLLTPWALFAMVERLNAEPELDLLYSDEDRLAPDGRRILAYLKPEWSPEFVHSYHWPGHLSLYRRSLIESLGGFRSEYDGSQDYDLFLRAVTATERVAHVRGVLYSWRMIEGSAAAGGKSDARRTNLGALRAAIAAQGRPARIVEYPGANRVVFHLVDRPLVSIVIPTDDAANAHASVNGILTRTSYERFEVIVVTNAEVAAELERRHGENPVRCVVYDGPFNFSLKCNLGAEAAEGEYLLFLNDDVVPLSEGWIDSMLQYAQHPEIGGVSPKLLYADDRIQYAGLVAGVRDLVGTAFHTWPRLDGTYHSMAIALRNVSCLTGACMLMRATDFHRVGGWDAVNTPIAHSDFDLSFRLQDAGLRLVYTPFAELRHLGHVSRRHARPNERLAITRADRGANVYFLHRWGNRIATDPNYTSDMRELLYEDASDYEVLAPPGRELGEGWWERPRALLVGVDLSGAGAPVVLVEVARALQRAGWLVVVTAAEGGPLVETLLELGIPVVLDGEIVDDPLRAAEFMRGFDVVAANTVLNWRAVRVAAGVRVPALWLIQESRFGLKLLRSGGREAEAAFAEASRVVFPSRATAELYRGFGGAERHTAIHYGIPDVALETSPEPAFERREGTFTIVNVGSLEERKGADVLLAAVRLLPSELAARVKVLLVGRPLDVRYVARLEAEAAAAGLDVELTGAVPRAVALAYARDADVVVCSSRDESGPLVVMEAMALGTAVVTTAVGAAAEIISPGVDGEVIEVDDAAALASRLERLAGDPELRARLGREARRTFERHLTAERYGDEIAEVFRAALPTKAG